MIMDIAGIAVVPLILAVVQAFKAFTSEKMHKYSSLLSIILGFAFAWLSVPNGEAFDFKSLILNGLVLGLTASGLYSSTKSLMKEDSSTVKELQ